MSRKGLVPEKKLVFYVHWVSSFLSYCEKQGCSPADNSRLKPFLHLLAKSKEEWQVDQAREALRLFHFFQSDRNGREQSVDSMDSQNAWRSIGEQMRESLRLRHRSLRTEKSYMQWLRSFYLYLEGKSPSRIDSQDVKRFLSHLAVTGKVSASTQNQAFSALLFLFRNVLDRPLEDVADTVRASSRKKLPVVLKKHEIQSIFEKLGPLHTLMAQIIYGGGLRAQECISLRVKDIDFEQSSLTIRSGKGGKDRPGDSS
ncbi:MAG: phage integrase N-terminal SAM-like domain-containing protein [Desulfobulbaceae bacterium]|nr:phage integrase N-terminal SAM-like domain-containing protein [Desulfobulbaceae bacterium]